MLSEPPTDLPGREGTVNESELLSLLLDKHPTFPGKDDVHIKDHSASVNIQSVSI